MRIIITVLISCILLGCSVVFKQAPLLPRENLKVAVLPFTARGPALSGSVGHIAADELTTLLFTDKQIPIVDRSQVNYCLEMDGINNAYFLSRQQLAQIADSLTASVVVLGLIENRPRASELTHNRSVVAITLRFLNAENGEVLTIVHQEKAGKVPQAMVQPLLTELVREL